MLTIGGGCVRVHLCCYFCTSNGPDFDFCQFHQYCQSRCESVLLTKVVVSAILPSVGHESSFPQELWLVKGSRRVGQVVPPSPCLVPPVPTLHRGPHLVLVGPTQAQRWTPGLKPRQLSNVLGQPILLSSCFYSHFPRICWCEAQWAVQSCVSIP